VRATFIATSSRAKIENSVRRKRIPLFSEQMHEPRMPREVVSSITPNAASPLLAEFAFNNGDELQPPFPRTVA
jgi:hypothetical protein